MSVPQGRPMFCAKLGPISILGIKRTTWFAVFCSTPAELFATGKMALSQKSRRQARDVYSIMLSRNIRPNRAACL
jgi:hypothetical protein